MSRWAVLTVGVLNLITACGGGGSSRAPPVESVKTPALPFLFATVNMVCSNTTVQTALATVDTVELPGQVKETWSDGVFVSVLGPPNSFVGGTSGISHAGIFGASLPTASFTAGSDCTGGFQLHHAR